MKVTVKDFFELAAFADAKVLAGERNLGSTVKKVSVLEATTKDDVRRFCAAPNQMMLTSFFGINQNEDAQCQVIEALVSGGTTALVVFHVGQVVKAIGKKVIDTAERLGLPLIVLSERLDLDMGDVIDETMSKLFYGSSNSFGNDLINNTIFHLLNFEKYSNFQSAIRAAAMNNDFQLILLSEDFNPIFSVETRNITTIDEAIRLGKEREVEKQAAVYTMIDVNGVLTYWGPVSIHDQKYFMFIVDNEDSYSKAEITKLAEIIELAMGMWKYTPERDAKAEFIKAIRRGNKSLAYTLKDEAGINVSEIRSVFYAKGIEHNTSSSQIANFEKETDFRVLKIIEGEETYGIVLGQKIEGISYVNLFDRLKDDKQVRIFHVTGIDGIESAADAYRLINETWSFVQVVFPFKRVFTKYEMALVSNCINIQLQGGYVKKNYMDLLDTFRDAGENKGKQLLDTLETFVLDAGMNSGKTAEFMGIHANTVQYRLKKINDILGVEITGNRVIPGLTISLALKRLEKLVSQ